MTQVQEVVAHREVQVQRGEIKRQLKQMKQSQNEFPKVRMTEEKYNRIEIFRFVNGHKCHKNVARRTEV